MMRRVNTVFSSRLGYSLVEWFAVIDVVGKRLRWRCDRLPLMLAPHESASVAIRANGPEIAASRAAELVAYCEANRSNSPFQQSIAEYISLVSSEGNGLVTT
jgi:hypothetical protein